MNATQKKCAAKKDTAQTPIMLAYLQEGVKAATPLSEPGGAGEAL